MAERYDFRVVDQWNNGEFLTGARVEYLDNGEVVDSEDFYGSSEFPGEDAVTQAVSSGQAWVECRSMSLEERLAPFGPEWERERREEGR